VSMDQDKGEKAEATRELDDSGQWRAQLHRLRQTQRDRQGGPDMERLNSAKYGPSPALVPGGTTSNWLLAPVISLGVVSGP